MWLKARRPVWRMMRRAGLSVMVLAVMSSLSACSGRWPQPGTPAAAAEWPAALVGAWALVGGTARGSSVPDTTVWVLSPGGLLEHREVQVRPQGNALAARERAISTSRWWTKDRTVDGVQTRVVCTSQRPGRNSQCAQVTVDTVTDAQAGPRRRLTWTGVTFRDQHWTFTERPAR